MSAPESLILGQLDLQKKMNLSDYIISTLKDAMFSGMLPAGSRLVEENLAKTFNVSKTPLREALSVLQTEGLVESVPFQGKFVASIGTEQLIETYQVRSAIENLSARLATERMDRVFEKKLLAYRKLFAAPVDEGDPKVFLKKDHEFHGEVFQQSGNTTLALVYSNMVGRIRLGKVTTAFRNYRLTESAGEHLVVIDRMLEGDAQGAGEAMQLHINNLIGAMRTNLLEDNREGKNTDEN